MKRLTAALLAFLFLPSPSAAQKYDPSKWTNIRVTRLDSAINSRKIEIVSCFNAAGTQLWFSTKRGYGPDQLSTCDYRLGKFEDAVIAERYFATGSITMDDSGGAYFAMLSPNSDSVNPNDIDIYRILLANGDVEALPKGINTHGFESQPHISKDGKTLLFAKAIAAGKLEYDVDIFSSTKIDGKWTKARPIGGDINTTGYEGFTVLSPDGRFFYFMRRTNKRDPGMYYSEKLATGWSAPMPMPFNTGREMSLAFHPTENLCIIASARHDPKGADFDLYEVRYELTE